jgi:hypothetical protein
MAGDAKHRRVEFREPEPSRVNRTNLSSASLIEERLISIDTVSSVAPMTMSPQISRAPRNQQTRHWSLARNTLHRESSCSGPGYDRTLHRSLLRSFQTLQPSLHG